MRKTDNLFARLAIFTVGLLIMSLGIVLMIISDFGASPWDVLHVGLYYQFGLTIGTWSILVGFTILGSSAIMMKEWPQFGAYLNMILIGLFIDMYMLLPFFTEPVSWLGKIMMFTIGMVIYAYGMGIYLSAQLGAGPRDSFMLALQEKMGWKVSNARRMMEVTVLIIGWLLGGPVFIGTIIFSIAAGSFIGLALPQCRKITDKILKKRTLDKEIDRSANI
ncbi:YczE/YyaS/YitT family protein [Lederbergia lenta]|uniref:Integral inner membrane protein regulating antibiotic production n=1 Tax=Lederbergia lenta TaxID=1467 RepID=A0A2X4VZJ1_LEDLE|nr:YitT family protein [Lederbergia lenta]MCM3111313.1 YitT family protein [Lederbergia lenta]MEC2325298.1 YitT family protein [Lederbergia lenta]SQI55839.1 integral inner membrane protein regulating antibiotic production [Lederbergia lenta]